jgi:carbon storage regulator CsrA
MLVLSRRLQERILFPGIDTLVQVMAIKPNLVRLGIEPPPEVTIVREDLQGRAAVELPPGRPAAGMNSDAKVLGLDHVLQIVVPALGRPGSNSRWGVLRTAKCSWPRFRRTWSSCGSWLRPRLPRGAGAFRQGGCPRSRPPCRQALALAGTSR